MIVIAGNIKFISNHFESGQDRRIERNIVNKFAHVFGMDSEEFRSLVAEYHQFFSRVNHPSKNILYAMSKSVFYKYNLNSYQVEYFRKVNAPNPVFLKKMDEIIQHFIWDWDTYKTKYNIVK